MVNWRSRRDRPARSACPSTHSREMLLPTDFGGPWTTLCGIEGARTGVPVHGKLCVLESFVGVCRDWVATPPKRWMLTADRPSDHTERSNRTVEANLFPGREQQQDRIAGADWARKAKQSPPITAQKPTEPLGNLCAVPHHVAPPPRLDRAALQGTPTSARTRGMSSISTGPSPVVTSSGNPYARPVVHRGRRQPRACRR